MKYLAALLLLSLCLFSCGDEEIDAPDCIKTELDAFTPDACSDADLTIWRFRGQDVYCFNYGTCISDSYADIFDSNCVLLCTLGGISGNNICDGEEWDLNAELVSTVWSN